MSTLIDFHSHIQFSAYDNDREAVILRAREAKVKMIAVGTQAQTSEDAIRVAEQYPNDVLGASVGFHPGHASENSYHDKNELREEAQESFDIERLRELAKHPKVLAIGECGLDYYRDQRLEISERQKKVFVQQIELARELQKPLIIHCRSAFGDLINILNSKSHILNSPAGVIHFFSGTKDDAKNLLDLKFYLGFGGVITFAREYNEVIRYAPLDRILLETDAPYVAPAPHRGKRNEPAYVVEVAKKLAELKGISPETIAEQTTQNAISFFGLSVE
ncbi:TatD family hydrolase [Patescibacteria group bacterium]|nr:TatD family hydrolase [Patescibacteria group bacterium]